MRTFRRIKVAVSSVVSLRKAPFPYKAMLAISDDIDGMTWSQFRSLTRFIRTRKQTEYGVGLGLDFAESCWIYSPPVTSGGPASRRISVFNGLTPDAESPDLEELSHYIRSGWIDTLHSLGDFSSYTKFGVKCTREHAVRAAGIFYRQGIDLPVWVNHGNSFNTQNIGIKAWHGGGRFGDESYLGDLLGDLGISFLNTVTNTGPMETEIAPLASPWGRPLWSFTRSFAGPTTDSEIISAAARAGQRDESGVAMVYYWHPHMLQWQLSDEQLSTIVASRSLAIFGQHLGFTRGKPFPESGIEALRRLRSYQDRGDILVSRTSRLLEYMRQQKCLRWSSRLQDDRLVIDIKSVHDDIYGPQKPMLSRLRGITFLVDEPETTDITIQGEPIFAGELVRSPPGSDASIGIAWHSADTTDYTPT